MKPMLRIAVILLVLLGIAGGLVWGFRASRSQQAGDADSDAPVEAPSHITVQAGKTVLFFDGQAQRVNGIAVRVLAANRRSAAVQATGVVLQLQPLLDLKGSYNTAQMEIAKARAAAHASQAEAKRLLMLNRDGENVSQKAVETAQAAAQSDAAVLENAQQSMAMLKDSMQLHWGAVIAGWLKGNSAQFDSLVSQRAFLLQVTAIDNSPLTPPAQALVQLPGGAHLAAHRIGPLPQLDPRLQTPATLYVVAAHPGLTPGVNVSVSLPSGPVRSGVILPSSAVVWWQGDAWCYVETSPGKFIRQEISTANPAPGGWFVTEGIQPGARVVTAGAQTLLAEEFRSQIQTGQDDD